MPEEQSPPVSSYGSILLTYIVLLVLAGTSVTLSTMNLGGANLWGPLLIAPIQAGLVIFFFMHMRHEKRLLKLLLLAVLVTLSVFIALTFVDTLFR